MNHVSRLPTFSIASRVLIQAVRKWKNLGKVLCRLLRMSDYWYGFASDGALLSNEERAARRISVLQQVDALEFFEAGEALRLGVGRGMLLLTSKQYMLPPLRRCCRLDV